MLGERRLGVIGIGNMGEALVRGVLKGGLLPEELILVSDLRSEHLEAVEKRFGIRVTSDNEEVTAHADILLLAVKPQGMDQVLEEIRDHVRTDQVIVSIAAGVTTGHISNKIGKSTPIIRVMPNTPALVGEGASAYCLGSTATAEHGALVREILDAVGISVEVDESLMNPITAVSGTGPAYIFYTLEAMIEAAKKLGMDDGLARTLVQQTVLGSARLVMESGEDPSVLRARVTSKGGTTQAAIQHLDENEYQRLVIAAIGAACDRAYELDAGDG